MLILLLHDHGVVGYHPPVHTCRLFQFPVSPHTMVVFSGVYPGLHLYSSSEPNVVVAVCVSKSTNPLPSILGMDPQVIAEKLKCFDQKGPGLVLIRNAYPKNCP